MDDCGSTALPSVHPGFCVLRSAASCALVSAHPCLRVQQTVSRIDHVTQVSTFGSQIVGLHQAAAMAEPSCCTPADHAATLLWLFVSHLVASGCDVWQFIHQLACLRVCPVQGLMVLDSKLVWRLCARTNVSTCSAHGARPVLKALHWLGVLIFAELPC